jgi:hypothetical protein
VDVRHSANGCRFVERILTVAETLRQQKRSVLSFLYDAIKAPGRTTLTPTHNGMNGYPKFSENDWANRTAISH